MKSSREQFEDWVVFWFDDDLVSRAAMNRDSCGQYTSLLTQSLWESWQASREAMAQEEVTTAPFIKVSE